MKLQFNQAGAWRQVMQFDAFQVDRVMAAAEDLVALANGVRMRIVKNDGSTVVYSYDPATGDWSDR